MTIFEHQWENKVQQEIIKLKLKVLLNIDQKRIYARKCEVKEISSKEKNEFLNSYHIQGEDKSKIKLGLFFETELVAVMTFTKPRFNKNYQWELSRYASKYKVIGGAGKLLKYFERNYKPESIITYADRRFSKGNLYNKLGFTLDHISEPGFVWIKSNHMTLLNRMQCFKESLKKLFNDYDENISVDENLINHHFTKLYDCGNLVYILKLDRG